MIVNEEFTTIYHEVEKNIEIALTDIQGIKITNKKSNEHLERLKGKLSEIKNQFSNEIHYLEENSEWEKFTIAFFGETNSGKSTILESLRILFEEKKRQEKIRDNTIDIEELEKSFSSETDSLITKLNHIYDQYNKQTNIIHTDISNLVTAYKMENNLLRKVIVFSIVVIVSFLCGMVLNTSFPDLLPQ